MPFTRKTDDSKCSSICILYPRAFLVAIYKNYILNKPKNTANPPLQCSVLHLCCTNSIRTKKPLTSFAGDHCIYDMSEVLAEGVTHTYWLFEHKITQWSNENSLPGSASLVSTLPHNYQQLASCYFTGKNLENYSKLIEA